MNTLITSLYLTLIVSIATFASPVSQPSKKDRPTKLARYQTGIYSTADGTRLRVNIDKELGGRVDVQLKDIRGNLYVERTLSPLETQGRFSLDLSQLTDGDYVLKVSNGLEMEIHDVKVTTRKPTVATRSITIL